MSTLGGVLFYLLEPSEIETILKKIVDFFELRFLLLKQCFSKHINLTLSNPLQCSINDLIDLWQLLYNSLGCFCGCYIGI